MKVKFILCEDGSYLHIRNITRLFLAEDITKGCGIKAIVIGPVMPFLVADYDTREQAAQALQQLVAQIEGETELWNSTTSACTS